MRVCICTGFIVVVFVVVANDDDVVDPCALWRGDEREEGPFEESPIFTYWCSGMSTLLKTSVTSPARIRAIDSMESSMLSSLFRSRAMRIQLFSVARFPSCSRVLGREGEMERWDRH